MTIETIHLLILSEFESCLDVQRPHIGAHIHILQDKNQSYQSAQNFEIIISEEQIGQ